MGLKFILPHKVAVPASPEPDSTVENTRHSKWGLLSPINIPPVSLHEIAHRATGLSNVFLILQQTVIQLRKQLLINKKVGHGMM